MIEIIKKSEEIAIMLESLVEEGAIYDYRLYLRTNERLYAYIKVKEVIAVSPIESKIHSIFANCYVEVVPSIDEDDFYTGIFANPEKIVFSKGRRRLNSLFSKDKDVLTEDSTPIVTFYSYKGGMGRTTTLASFATYLALKKKMNVFIIDCDLEAPGFNNFFLKYPGEQNNQQGLVEYLIDRETGLVSKEKIKLYCHEVSHEYSDKGIIRVMHAGNLDTTKKRDSIIYRDIEHYIEGLSRIDLGNTEYSIKLFKDLFSDIIEAFTPDVILIDSKTGLSDVMGLTVCSLSDIVVGFFRNDAQSWPGLHFFIQTMVGKNNVEPFIVNSILPSSISIRKSLFSKFKEDVTSIINDVEEFSDLDFPCFGIYRQDELELIGTAEENVEDFVAFIKEDEFKPYKELFESLSERICIKKNEEVYTQSEIPDSHSRKLIQQSFTPVEIAKIGKMSLQERKQIILPCKQYILSKTYEAIESLNLYADNISIEDEIDNHRFFYRQCMDDLFNQDRYMILGSKGTGKSYLYSTLRSSKGVSYLQRMAQRSGKYVFLYTIDKIDRIFSVEKLGYDISSIQKYRFWIIYTWNSIALDIEKQIPGFHFSEGIPLFKIKDDDTTFELFKLYINDEEYTKRIESEMSRLDDYLSGTESINLSIVYDQLDEIVNPSIWSLWIPELINIWRGKRFSNISGKLFVRTDLFRALVGLSNKNDIENKAVNIEWSKEEIYSYFFKIVLSDKNVQTAIWDYLYLVGYDKAFISQCRRDYEKKDQFRLDEYILSSLVSEFFGEYVDTKRTTRMGTSYEWFYKNLRNADGTISLRPFIDLLKNAIQLQSEGIYSEEEPMRPILYQKYYTNRDVRVNAVKRHYEDLVSNTIGNKPIDYIFEFIRNTNNPYFKYISIHKKNFENMLSQVISKYGMNSGMQGMTIEKLKTLLECNGIVCKVNYGRGDDYVFSFLYKYSLGLRGV